jgi:hypothetical protein
MYRESFLTSQTVEISKSDPVWILPKSGFLINHKRKLTSLPVLRYSSDHRKGRLKILYLDERKRLLGATANLEKRYRREASILVDDLLRGWRELGNR